MLVRFKKCVIIVGFLLVWAIPNYAQTMDTPVLLQVATFTKVFKYDAALRDKELIKLSVVHDGGNRTLADELVRAFRNAGLHAESASLQELNKKITGFDIIYIMPGVKSASGLCKRHRKLSISGMSKYAEDGTASVALGLVNDKPRLFVNLNSLQKEGHTLSAKLLQVVRVF